MCALSKVFIVHNDGHGLWYRYVYTHYLYSHPMQNRILYNVRYCVMCELEYLDDGFNLFILTSAHIKSRTA